MDNKIDNLNTGAKNIYTSPSPFRGFDPLMVINDLYLNWLFQAHYTTYSPFNSKCSNVLTNFSPAAVNNSPSTRSIS